MYGAALMLNALIALVPADVAADPALHTAWQSTVQTIVLAVIGLLGSLVTGLITLAGKKLLVWIDARAKASSSEAHYAAFRCATEKLNIWSRAAVDEIEQTLVRKLKRQGRWNKETARMARNTAVEVMRRHAGDTGIAELQQCLDQSREAVLDMFRTWVERQVRNDGSSGGASPIVSMGDNAGDDLDGDGIPDGK